MNWLMSNSPRRQSFRISRSRSTLDAASDCDPKACYDSFCKHWQQVYDIILRAEPNKPSEHDDVLGVVSHLDHMVTLLLVELQSCNKMQVPGIQAIPPAQCLEFLLSENLLDKLYEWGKSTGRYADAVRLEQIKLYELLVSHSRHQLLVHQSFFLPLKKLLASSQGEHFPADIEKRLVILLNQLCVVLMQNVHLLDLFFLPSTKQKDNGPTNFIIFSLLIPYVHREGSLGHQARDALLLCMALSQKNSNVGTYIAQYSSMCPFLVTGLGGSYSSLPNTIKIIAHDWHRITPDDVAEIPELTLFMNSLEFCNAVVQVAHKLIREQLLNYMYQGFIVPILGPALLQNNTDSQVSAMAYLELILRSVTEPGLLKVFIQFLLDEEKFDGQRMLDILIERISSSDARLCMVSFSLFDTLIALHCEDIMLELLLKYLRQCKHIPSSHRHKINQTDYYDQAAENFIDLSPEVMKHTCDSQSKQQQQQQQQQYQNHHHIQSLVVSKTIGANWNHYNLNTSDSLYSNYHAYLFDARQKIMQCQRACESWSNKYCYETTKKSKKTVELLRNFLNEFTVADMDVADGGKQMDSLQSNGESSGYESFKYKPEDDDVNNISTSNGSEIVKKRIDCWKKSNRRKTIDGDSNLLEESLIEKDETLGPFISAIWTKLETFTSNTLYVNLHLTGLITRIAWYPLPLIHTIFLRSDIPTTCDVPSFHQVLRILKQQIDAELPVTEESLELVDTARSVLIEREIRLINTRKAAIETSRNPGRNGTLYNQSATANISAATPPQANAVTSYDPFRRGDRRRQSFTTSITNIFKRPSISGSSNANSSSNSGSGFSIKDNTTSSEPSSLIYDNAHTSGGGSTGGNNIDMMTTNGSTNANLTVAGTSSMINSNNDRNRDLAICAVMLDEWLRELSAITYEQSLAMINCY